MKNLINLCFLTFALFIISCGDPDPCKDKVCGPQGSCDDGTCLCEDGYEQDGDGLCNTEMRMKFLGSYTASENCTTGSYNYNVTIATSTQDNKTITITNLYDDGVSFNAKLTDGSTFEIPSGTMMNSSTVAGTGVYNMDANTVTVTYTVDNGLTTDSCTSTLTKL